MEEGLENQITSPQLPNWLVRNYEKMTTNSNSKKAQEIQDEIFQKMPAAKKVKLAFEFSSFLLKLNKINRNEAPKTSNKSS